MPEAKRNKLAIIDGKSVFYRGYYAMPNLATDDGVPTGGVYGFATMALEVIRRLKPDYVAVAWDKPKTNIRKRLEMYPEYKAGRKPAPPDFNDQVPILHDLLKAFGWPLYELDDYEADDIMGTLACQATAQNIETMLITSDLDMLQLIDPFVHVYALKTGLSNIELYSPVSFEAKYGLKVTQFLDLKALKGDSSDNIPGVPGIGEKTAIKLLQEYDSLDNIYANLELIPDNTRKKLDSGRELAYLSKKLSSIWTDAPLKLNLEEVDGSKADVDEISRLLTRLQFRSLLRQLPEVLSSKMAANEEKFISVNFVGGKSVLIKSDEDLELINFAGSERVYIYSRAAGVHGADPLLLCLSSDGENTYVIDLTKVNKAALKNILNSLPPLVGHNLKPTIEMLSQLGINPPPVAHDTLIAAFVLNSLRRGLTLSDLAQSELSYGGKNIDDLDPVELITYAPTITMVLKTLVAHQQERIDKVKAYPSLLRNIDYPVISVLAQMELTGIKLDIDYLARFCEEIKDMLNDAEQQIYGYADEEFNIASPAQLAQILFNKLNIQSAGIKKGKSGYSTAANVLEKLRHEHPIVEQIMRYREIAKLKNTYVDTLPKLIDKHGRLHTTFNLTIAQTGRLSSTDPNLQNIPTRTELGKRIRSAFVASEGKKLISADYSQFELRLAAVMADDGELIDMFNRGADIHLMTAAEIYDRKPDEVTRQMRSAAKTINFGILYGMSPHGLSVATGMSRDQAASFIDRYKKLRRPLFDYMDRLLDEAKKQGYVETMFGRRRLMPDINSHNYVVRAAAERAAINMPIQGTEADIMKLAMIKCNDWLTSQHNDCNQLLQIHDSILVECPAAVAEDVAKSLKEIMEHIHELPVRLDVDVKIGNNWGEL